MTPPLTDSLTHLLIDSPHLVLAVDPGLSGAIALVGRGRFEVRRDFKTLKDIADGILELLFRAEPDHLIIEQVGAMPGQGVCSMFSFGKSTGVALGALWAKHPRMTIEEVHPIRWQNWFRKTCNIPRPIPFDSQALAAKLLPAHAELFTARKKDHNTADAVLIGLWKLSQP